MKREGAEKQFVQKRENLAVGEGGWGMGEGRGNSFYQTLMDKDREGDGLGDSNGAKRRMEEGLEKQTGKSELEAGRTEGAKDSERDKEMKKNSSLPARESDMIIHVFDDQRKSKLYTTKHTNHNYSGNCSRETCCY